MFGERLCTDLERGSSGPEVGADVKVLAGERVAVVAGAWAEEGEGRLKRAFWGDSVELGFLYDGDDNYRGGGGGVEWYWKGEE